MENHVPSFGVAYNLRTMSVPVADASIGADQTWDYSAANSNLVLGYKVVDPSTLPSNIKDSVPTAEYCYQQQGAPNAGLAGADFYSNEGTHYLKVGTKNSGSNPVERKNDTVMVFGQTYGSTMYYAGFNRLYAGYGTLKIAGKTYNNIVMIKSYNSTLTPDTIVQFHQFSPFYQLVFSYTKSSGTIKNMVYFEITSTGNSSGIAENRNSEIVSIYPNPAKSQININAAKGIENASIYSLTGQKVKTIILNQQDKPYSIEDLNSGIYMIVVGNETRKLIIE